MLEPWLAFFHISAVLAWVVFASSQAALCRVEWLNAAAVQRLARLDTILWAATAAIVLTGLARIYLGAKGASWYWGNPLLHLKLTLLLVIALLQFGASRRLWRWQAAAPAEPDIRHTRHLIMIAAHLMALLPLAAVFMARGWGAGAG